MNFKYYGFLLLLISCSNEKPTPVCVANIPNKVLSYQTDIVPIIQNNCISCHATRGARDGVILDNYESVKHFAETGELYESIMVREDGSVAMPRGGRLSDCEITTIKNWIDQGINQ